MTKKEVADWIRELEKEGKLYKFYKSKEWKKLKEEVLKESHRECAWCKDRGKISAAVEVHHIQFVKRHPELALSKTYVYKGSIMQNLVPLCHDCHDKAHGRMGYKKKVYINSERW